MSRSFHKVARLTFIGTASAGAGRFIYLVLVGRLLGPTILGDVSVLLAIIVMIGGFIQLSIGDAATKFVAESCGNNAIEKGIQQYSGLVTLSLVLIFLSGSIIIAMNEIIATLGVVLFSIFDITIFLLLIGGFVSYTLVRAGFYGFGLAKEYSLLEVILNIVFILLTYFLIISNADLVIAPLFVLYIGISVLGLIFLYSKHLFHVSFSDSRSLFTLESGMMKFVGLTSLIGLSGLVNGFAPIMMSFFLTASEIGFYAAASSFMIFVTFLPLVFNRTTLPTISYIFGTGEKEDVKRFVNKGLKLVTESQIFFPMSLILLSSIGLFIMYGAGYNESVLTLRLLSINAFVSGIASYLYNVLAGTNNVEKGVWASLVSTFFIVLSWLTMIPLFGIVGAAFALLISAIVRLVLMAYWTHMEFPLKISFKTIAIFMASFVLVVAGITLEFIFPSWDFYILAVSEGLLFLLLIKPVIGAFRRMEP
ncbi:MAG: polysaccharide biosynthesis C-terminal domain-containing protein [Promethearchaeota archaeon]